MTGRLSRYRHWLQMRCKWWSWLPGRWRSKKVWRGKRLKGKKKKSTCTGLWNCKRWIRINPINVFSVAQLNYNLKRTTILCHAATSGHRYRYNTVIYLFFFFFCNLSLTMRRRMGSSSQMLQMYLMPLQREGLFYLHTRDLHLTQ